MRLIDADELILHLNDFMLQQSPIDIQDIESIHVSAVIQDCINAVEEQSTAYDVDKVLEQLKIEEKLAEEEKKRCSCCSTTQWEEAKGYANGISVAIDIVKGGGLDGLDKIN